MSESVSLPALGESVTEGTVTRWLKNVGDRVEVDEPLLEVSTDKVDTEIPSPVAGVVEAILVAEDETVEVGTALVTIGSGADAVPAAPAESGHSSPAAASDTTVAAASPEDAQPAPVATPSVAAPTATAAPQPTESTPDYYSSNPVTVTSEPWGTDEAQSAAHAHSVEVPSADAPAAAEHPAANHSAAENPATPETDRASAPVPAAGIDEPPAVDVVEAPAEPAVDHTAVDPTAISDSPVAPVPDDIEPEAAAPAEAPAPAEAAASAASTVPDAHAGYVTPLVRKLAHERGIDLAAVTGTGVGGRIRKQDVLAAAEPQPEVEEVVEAAPVEQPASAVEVSALRGTTVAMSRLRRVIAERAVVSMQSSAQLTSVVEVDVTLVARYRDSVKEQFLSKTGTKLSFLPFFAVAAAEALQQIPIVNATIDGDNIVYPAQENLSIAVDTERGLLTPVIRDAASLTIAELAAQIADLASRTRENKLKPDELAGGTFTLTNTGSRGALFDTPIVFLPQSAILGTGIVTKKPAVVEGAGGDAIAIRSMVYLALSYDHRIVDGADAARFLVAVKDRLEAGDFAARLGI